jgi:hypothetical protein
MTPQTKNEAIKTQSELDFENLITKEIYDLMRDSRGSIYGEALDNHLGIAQVWASILKPHWREIRQGIPLPVWVIPLLMMGLKYNRMRLTYHEDNFTDDIVYMSMVKKWQKEWSEQQKRLVKIERIYVSGPYSAPTKEGVIKNIETAAKAAVECFKRGHLAYVPHICTAPMDGLMDYEDFMRVDLDVIMYWPSAILYLAQSPGADRELALAQRIGLKIYRSVDEIPNLKPDF